MVNTDNTKQLLQAASALLAEGTGVSGLTPDVVAKRAGVPPSAYSSAFPELAEFKSALLRTLLDEVLGEAAVASKDMNPGVPRMCRATEQYLDAMLKRPAIRELMLTLQGHRRAGEVNKSRIDGFVMIFRVEFLAVGAKRAMEAARLATAMVIETAMAEFDARRALPEFREVLYAFYRRHGK